MSDIILKVENVSKYFILKKTPISKKHIIRAVDNVSFNIYKGESLGLIGESGSGKSTLSSIILRLLKCSSGKIFYKGINITNFNESKMKSLRHEIQVIFQYTQEILDPKMTVGELIMEPLGIYDVVPYDKRENEALRLLDIVGIPEDCKHKFPYQLSGGQRQRVGIARAISLRPQFIICDEPVSALDVSVQGQILNLLSDLKDEMELTYLFISHDLKVVKHFCDRIAVMHNGKIVEIGSRDKIMNNPENEYTKMLINSHL